MGRIDRDTLLGVSTIGLLLIGSLLLCALADTPVRAGLLPPPMDKGRDDSNAVSHPQLSANTAIVMADATAGFPFYDGFESGVLGSSWTTYTVSEGRVQTSSTYPYSGAYSVLLDDYADNTIYSYSAVILTIDLSGQSDVALDFAWRDFGDEDDDADGVFFSEDGGTTWITATNFVGSQSTFRRQVVDVDAVAAANGLLLNDQFQIKFQFYDNYSITADGYAIDEVCLYTPRKTYLPVVMKRWPPIPYTPVLNPISNSDNDGYYTVDWDTAELADTYQLQEDDNAAFSSPLTRYSGHGTSWSASGQPYGTYYYRVRAVNSWGYSGWSNTRSTVVLPPTCSVYVVNSTGGSLCYEIYGTGIGRKCYSSGTHYYGSFPVGTYT